MATRLHTVCTTASPADTQRDAEKVAETLRGNGEYVRLSAIFWMPEGTRKAGLPAIQLEVSDEPFKDAVKTVEVVAGAVPEAPQAAPQATPAVTQPIAERPMTLAEMDARDRQQVADAKAEAERQAALPPEEQVLVDDSDLNEHTAIAAGVEPAVKRRGGRPKGSKNKQKAAA